MSWSFLNILQFGGEITVDRSDTSYFHLVTTSNTVKLAIKYRLVEISFRRERARDE
jgi:hypothetical protein